MSMADATSRASVGEPAGAASVADPAALIQAIGSGAADPMSLLLSQLGGQAQNDPRMALLMQLLQQRQSAPASEPEQDDEDAELAAQQAELARHERARHMRELSHTVKKAYAELEVLRKRNDALAAALGACFLCFGADPVCAECGGRGSPGSRPPEPSAYREYVLPALRRVRMIQSMAARRAPANFGPMAGVIHSVSEPGAAGATPRRPPVRPSAAATSATPDDEEIVP
jgi:hypothetical protein